MALRLKLIDRDTPMLLPPDLRDWVPENHIVHFILDAVQSLPLEVYDLNWRGSGSRQYPPGMMLALLIYCYVTGRFTSRIIEEACYSDIAVRYICANTCPDHATICEFRRKNGKAFKTAFVDVLEMASRQKNLKKVGTVSVDGTKINANASKHSAVSYAKAGEMLDVLKLEVEELNARAEAEEQSEKSTGLDIPAEITRREDRIAKLQEAREIIKERHRLDQEKKRPGKEPTEVPDKNQYNFTDPESRIMKAGNGQHFEQSYNAQAVVDTQSMLIVGKHVTNAANDKEQLVPALESVPEELSYKIENVLADSGYYSEEAVKKTESENGPTVYAAVGRVPHHKSIQDLEEALRHSEPDESGSGNTDKEAMIKRLKTSEGRALYKLRKQTVEPVFGIIKEVMGFRRFLTRGIESVCNEWDLVTLSYNCKRLYNIMNA